MNSPIRTRAALTLASKVAAATALFVAAAGLVNGAIDLVKAVAKLPVGRAEQTNDALFKKHFGKLPLYSQPVSITESNVTVEMVLQVYDSGDVLVRYGKFEQWLPFKSPQLVGAWSLFPTALAQAAPTAAPREGAKGSLFREPLVIDIDRIKRQAPSASGAATLEKSFALAHVKDDHSLLRSSTETFVQTFKAEPGYRIADVDLQVGSANNYRIERTEIIEDGRAARVQFSLTSGPAFDRYRGWVQGTVKTRQERLQ